jgi:hypothetical protein
MDWKPIDLVDDLLDDLRSGKERATKMLVLIWRDEEDGTTSCGERRAGLSRSDEVSMLRLHEHRIIRRWRGLED